LFEGRVRRRAREAKAVTVLVEGVEFDPEGGGLGVWGRRWEGGREGGRDGGEGSSERGRGGDARPLLVACALAYSHHTHTHTHAHARTHPPPSPPQKAA
jgi:hypothetical protein